MSHTFLSASYGLMEMKCGRCRLASHCIQLAVSGSRLPWPSNTRMQCSQRASTPILLLPAPRLHAAFGKLAAAAVARRARGGRVAPRQPADREADARSEVATASWSSAAGSPAARRAARRRCGRGSRQTRSDPRRRSRAHGREWCESFFGQPAHDLVGAEDVLAAFLARHRRHPRRRVLAALLSGDERTAGDERGQSRQTQHEYRSCWTHAILPTYLRADVSARNWPFVPEPRTRPPCRRPLAHGRRGSVDRSARREKRRRAPDLPREVGDDRHVFLPEPSFIVASA